MLRPPSSVWPTAALRSAPAVVAVAMAVFAVVRRPPIGGRPAVGTVPAVVVLVGVVMPSVVGFPGIAVVPAVAVGRLLNDAGLAGIIPEQGQLATGRCCLGGSDGYGDGDCCETCSRD